MKERTCCAKNRCQQWRYCSRCARIRQAKIADKAQHHFAHNHYLSYLVLTSYSAQTFAADKKRLLRCVRHLSIAGLWTVEQGTQFQGLHLNIIIATEEPLQLKNIERCWGPLGQIYQTSVVGWRSYWLCVAEFPSPFKFNRQGKTRGKRNLISNARPCVHHPQMAAVYQSWLHLYQQPHVTHKYWYRATFSLRCLAAYCSKQRGIPPISRYKGRLYGVWGSRQSEQSKNEGWVSLLIIELRKSWQALQPWDWRKRGRYWCHQSKVWLAYCDAQRSGFGRSYQVTLLLCYLVAVL